VRALADLHGALTRIRDRVFRGAAAAAAAALACGRDTPLASYRFERDLRNAIANVRRGPPTPIYLNGILPQTITWTSRPVSSPWSTRSSPRTEDEDAGPGRAW
jgi:hypothetical protein